MDPQTLALLGQLLSAEPVDIDNVFPVAPAVVRVEEDYAVPPPTKPVAAGGPPDPEDEPRIEGGEPVKKVEAKAPLPSSHAHVDLYGSSTLEGDLGFLIEAKAWAFADLGVTDLKYFLKNRLSMSECQEGANNFMVHELTLGVPYGFRVGAHMKMPGLDPFPVVPGIQNTTKLTDYLGVFTAAGMLWSDQKQVEVVAMPFLKLGDVKTEAELFVYFARDEDSPAGLYVPVARFRPRVMYEVSDGLNVGLRTEMQFITGAPDTYDLGVLVRIGDN